MFQKRKKQTFPEGTFIPSKQRILAITQLCLAFCAILYAVSWPFMGQYFEVKSQVLLFEHVKGEKSRELRKYFENLPQKHQQKINKNYQRALKVSNRSFLEKTTDSFNILFFKLSLYERFWILFAVIISVFLLKKREGAKEASLILPLIAAAYLINSEVHMNKTSISKERSLFPTEEFLTRKYLNNDLINLPLKEQQESLLKAWHFYVIEMFLNELPSADVKEFEEQAARGEHAFHAIRAKKINPPLLIHKSFNQKEPLFLLLIYLIWNTFFAFTMLNKPKPQLKNQEELAS